MRLRAEAWEDPSSYGITATNQMESRSSAGGVEDRFSVLLPTQPQGSAGLTEPHRSGGQLRVSKLIQGTSGGPEGARPELSQKREVSVLIQD